MTEFVQIAVGTIEGVASSAVFILALMIGFCVIVGLTKLKKTTGHGMVVKSLDETISHQPMKYYPPDAPRGPADQLRTPELLEASARSSQ
jgi:hypothetical protein